ncbi:Xylosidase/arabinosidase [Posidoniimonas corsicana]|uniref:Xylosidase/arabinosidase n=1 Tax=Posidoniimonas corsicana TaxID=1938618 RepID=A0A5C5VG72_9BACT|nr:family 43 glycosylhydrolase [Posidoniimonas corsicana]TWT37063.1 Xylosidase/arabinosidase [Posidoniimonas corsicana]
MTLYTISVLAGSTWARRVGVAVLGMALTAGGAAAQPAGASEAASRALPSRGNPIIGDGSYFAADAAPLSADGKLYIYFGHDEAEPWQGGFVMSEYGVLEIGDPTSGEWTLHEANLKPGKVFDWATGQSAYAGHATRGPDGRFYWYTPVQWKNRDVANRMAIGVAVSDSPVGPWEDAIGKPLLTWLDVFGDSRRGQEVIDPHVFTDDDGTVYLYWGSWYVARVVKLAPSMTATEGEIKRLAGLDAFFEAPWVFKRDGVYYMLYDWKRGGSKWTPSNYQAAIGYATAESPLGPWEFQDIILSGTSSTTVHPSMVEHDGRWWVTYHTKDSAGGGHFRRSVAIDEAHWDGAKILPVKQTWADDPALRLTNNVAREAEVSASFTEQPPMTLAALNDGRPETVRLPPDTWGNYRGNTNKEETDWIQYQWDTPVRIDGVGIQFHRDPNWIRPPAKWRLEYRDDSGEWQAVEADNYPTEVDAWNKVTFAPVTTTALRATFWGRPSGDFFHSVAASEWEVYAVQADELPRVNVTTSVGESPELPATVELATGPAGAREVPVVWREVDPQQYKTAGKFTVEGRAVGQAAGYVEADVLVSE